MGAEIGVQTTCIVMGAQTRIQLAVYFQFTSDLLPGNASKTDARPLVPLDAGAHTFFMLFGFSLCISMICLVFFIRFQ